jgi:hypothetical protein
MPLFGPIKRRDLVYYLQQHCQRLKAGLPEVQTDPPTFSPKNRASSRSICPMPREL